MVTAHASPLTGRPVGSRRNFEIAGYVHLTHIIVRVMYTSSPFTEGAPRRRSVGGAGRRRLQAGFAASSQEAGSPSGPDEGPAFNGWTRSDEGPRQCGLDHVR